MPVCVVCAIAAIIIGLVKKATLPIWDPDREQLRRHCTKPWVDKDGKRHSPMMSHHAFAQKPVAFYHKYFRHYTPPPYVIETALRKIPTLFAHLSDPGTGVLVFREGGPAMKALENLILLVKSGKLSGVLQRWFQLCVELTMTRSILEYGFHQACANHCRFATCSVPLVCLQILHHLLRCITTQHLMCLAG